MDKIPPHDTQSEKAILSCLLQDHETIDKIYEIISVDDFYNEKHRKIYEIILELNRKNEPFNAITVSSLLNTKHLLDKIGGMAYLLSLAGEVPTAAHSEYYAKIVAEKAVLRHLLSAAKNMSEEVYKGEKDVENILDYSEQTILDIANKKSSNGFSHIREIIHMAFDRLEILREQRHQSTGIPTFISLDELIHGFQKSDMIICAARPGMGKTSFCLNIAQNAATRDNTPVAIFSLEMSKEQLVTRLLSAQSMVNQTHIRQGSVDQEEFETLSAAAAKLINAPIFIDDTAGINAMEIRGKARRLKAEYGLGLIIIDYIQLMQSNGSGKRTENRQQEISDISRNLKLLAKELDVPVLALSQLSRAVEQTPDKKPNLSHLRESGSLEQDSDVVIFIYRPSYYENNDGDLAKDKTAEIIVAKHRHGPTGKATLVFLNEFTKFVDLKN